jgi:hypothetical protein
MSDSTLELINPDPEPLVYPLTEEGETCFTNVLLINREVESYQTFVDSANSSTFPIVYSVGSSKIELLELLKNKFSKISRIGLVFYSSEEDTKMFMDREFLFTDSNNVDDENIQFMINLIKEFQVQNIDYLACNALNHQNWVNYFNLLANNTGVVVGASDNKTGNLKYGGDWIMESTHENIENIYFSKNIEYYQYLLDTYVYEAIRYDYPRNGTTASVVGVSNFSSRPDGIANLLESFDISGNTYLVTSINNNSFANNAALVGINIPNSVTRIGDTSFLNCTGLTSIVIPSSVTTINTNVFFGCTNLKSVVINGSITTVNQNTFNNCTKLTNVSLPNTVTSIGYRAFKSCFALRDITIPPQLQHVDVAAFQECVVLQNINLPNSLTSISNGSFQSCGSATSIIIPNSVVNIGSLGYDNMYQGQGVPLDFYGAFRGCGAINSITIPNSVKVIGTAAFRYSGGLTSITIPNSVTELGINVFRECFQLSSVQFEQPCAINTINDNAFFDDPSLNYISLPTSIQSIGTEDAGVNTSAWSRDNDEYGVFAGSALTNILIPNSVTLIGAGAFSRCYKLSGITIPNSVTRISAVAFTGTFLTSFTMPNSVVSLGSGTFLGNRIRGITISNSLKTIPNDFCLNCPNLTSVIIPNSVTSIGSSAFKNCGSLTSIIILGPVNTIGGSAFADSNLLPTIYFSVNALQPAQTIPADNVSFYGKTVNLRFITVEQYKNLGYTISQLVSEFNLTIAQLYDNGKGFTVTELMNYGFTISQLYNNGNGLSLLLLYANGISVLQMYHAGIPPNAILTSNICFPAGTPVSTNQGIIPIELLDPEVHTIRDKKIVGITQTVSPDKSLVCFEKDALGPNVPSQKTIITKNHEILYKGKMIKAKEFVGKHNIYKVKYTGEVLYNVLMEEHEKMVINNMICETLNPENTIAKIYNILQTLSVKEQNELIRAYNTAVSKHKIFSSEKLNK